MNVNKVIAEGPIHICNECRGLIHVLKVKHRTRPDRSRPGRYVIQEYFRCPVCNHRNVTGVELQ